MAVYKRQNHIYMSFFPKCLLFGGSTVLVINTMWSVQDHTHNKTTPTIPYVSVGTLAFLIVSLTRECHQIVSPRQYGGRQVM